MLHIFIQMYIYIYIKDLTVDLFMGQRLEVGLFCVWVEGEVR